MPLRCCDCYSLQFCILGLPLVALPLLQTVSHRFRRQSERNINVVLNNLGSGLKIIVGDGVPTTLSHRRCFPAQPCTSIADRASEPNDGSFRFHSRILSGQVFVTAFTSPYQRSEVDGIPMTSALLNCALPQQIVAISGRRFTRLRTSRFAAIAHNMA